MEFELKLGGITYRCTSSHSNGAKDQNWHISADMPGGYRASITIPIEEKVNRAKAMCFTEAFHIAFLQAKKEQGLERF